MKALLRIVAGAALIVLLFFTTSGEGPASLSEPADAQPLPEAPDILENIVVFREDVSSVLLCLLSAPGGRVGSEKQPVALFLLSIDPAHGPALLNIPVGTRAPVRGSGDSGFDYDTPVGAYQSGAADGTQGLRLAECIGGLMGGIQIDRYMMLTVEGLEKLIDRLGGVSVSKYSFFSGVAGGVAQNDAVKLMGANAPGYILSSLPGTDVGALERQNHLLAALIERMSAAGISLSDAEEICGAELAHNLSDGDKTGIDGALRGADALWLEEQATQSLWGSVRLVDGQSWLPDRARIKEYVLERYYLAAEEM